MSRKILNLKRKLIHFFLTFAKKGRGKAYILCFFVFVTAKCVGFIHI